MNVFRRVVELRGFSAAARELRLSNAAVSKHVAALEDHLRTRLLNRTTRKVAPTPAGSAYYQRCLRVLEEVEDAERAVSRSSEVPQGVLRINAPMSFGLLHLSPLVPVLLDRFPELSIDLGLTDRFVDLVEEGVDLVIRIASELPDSASLVAQKLARTHQVVCASPKYLRRHPAPRTLGDLANHQCLVFSLGQHPGEWIFNGPDGPRRVPVGGRLQVTSSLVIREALLAGAGLAMMPAFYVSTHLTNRKLRALLTDHQSPPLHVYAVYQRSRHLSPKVRLVVDFLRQHFGGADWATPDK